MTNSVSFEPRKMRKISGRFLFAVIVLMFSVFLFAEGSAGSFLYSRSVQQATDLKEWSQPEVQPEQLIRFHVLANSDSDEDQALKRAVRDAILREVSPRLAASHSLEESRAILISLRPELEQIGQGVLAASGKDYPVTTDYGRFAFPTKSYGSLILQAGEYEAVRVLIGEARGSNWWCVLFPPLCFVDVEHSTAVMVDGKPEIPIAKPPLSRADKKPVVRFWLVEKAKELIP